MRHRGQRSGARKGLQPERSEGARHCVQSHEMPEGDARPLPSATRDVRRRPPRPSEPANTMHKEGVFVNTFNK